MQILGLDISKSSATYWLLSEIPRNPKQFSRTNREKSIIKPDQEGIQKLLEMQFDFAVIEPTGTYSRIWREILRRNNREYRLVGHEALANYRKSYQLNKTDKLDSLALAMYGLERHDRPESWLLEKTSTLKDLVAYLAHLNRQKNGFQNNLRQRLSWQVPEWSQRQIKRVWLGNPPGILRAISGAECTKKWQQELEATIGTGLDSTANSLGRILIAIEEEEQKTERIIELELAKHQYKLYKEAAEACDFGNWLTVNLIAAVYPFEQFLTAGKRRINRYPSNNGKMVSRDESLRAFKLACGMGQIFIQSGDYEGWVAGGNGATRTALYLAASISYIQGKKAEKKGESMSPDLAAMKGTKDVKAAMKVARKMVERYYKELWILYKEQGK